jgi:hypothetical protein
MVAIVVVLVVFVLLAVLAVFAIYKLVGKADDLVPGLSGDVECLTEDTVSETIGYPVTLAYSGSVVVAAGCNYTSAEATDDPRAGVSVVVGAGVIADEEIDDLVAEAEAHGVEAVPIDAGEDGMAWESSHRSEAITKSDGHVVAVEVFSEGTAPIGERRDAAIEVLELFLDAQ